MGLDMYLDKRTWVSFCDFKKDGKNCHGKAKITVEITYPDNDKKVQVFEPQEPEALGMYLVIPCCYWRKANAIHRWFVEKHGDDVDNCQEIYVDGCDLLELRDLCQQVIDDNSMAEQLLPTQDGFFFGSTEYDSYYFDELKRTVDMLKDVKADDEFVYNASW